jgi:two-component system phosphate regulon sensor histidine kinase PhoR
MWKLYSAFLLIIAVPALLFTWYTTTTFKNFFVTSTIEDLSERARQVAAFMEGSIGIVSPDAIDSLCKLIGRDIDMRFTVITADGTVLGDSKKDPHVMENHRNRSEVLAALAGNIGISDRFSNTIHERMVYVALPLHREGRLIGVMRTAISISVIHHELNRMYCRILLGYLLFAIAAALVSFYLSRRISLPVDAMKKGAQRFAAGNFTGRIKHSGTLEIDQLADALNEMGTRLHDTIGSLTEQRNRIDAVLSSMVEGVIALDGDQKILAINDAAVRLFSLPGKPADGTWIGEVLRNTGINSFMKRVAESGREIKDEILLVSDLHNAETAEQLLQLHGNALKDAEGRTIGVLAVINNITRIKRLETMRSDFVANVSHELRTPLTSVKGFVETLMAGAVDDRDEARHFLQIINRQVDRLSTIVEDLLTLSRMEQESQLQEPDVQRVRVSALFAAVVETCGVRAAARNITLETEGAGTLDADVEPALIEEALINLVDNAVNYSPEGNRVILSASVDTAQNELVLSVADSGPGIAAEHHERIFERFYRVDKARSRKLGGSGLGLSIVKHIALVHHGRATVKSAPGEGSTFYIHLPLRETGPEGALP